MADDLGTQAPSRWRKKPVEVEALRYDGPAWVPESERYSTEAFRPLTRFTRGRVGTVLVGTQTHGGPNQYAPAISTLEGRMVVSPGDWVIKGVKGEFYPCKPDIFEATYEPVEPDISGSSGGGVVTTRRHADTCAWAWVHIRPPLWTEGQRALARPGFRRRPLVAEFYPNCPGCEDVKEWQAYMNRKPVGPWRLARNPKNHKWWWWERSYSDGSVLYVNDVGGRGWSPSLLWKERRHTTRSMT